MAPGASCQLDFLLSLVKPYRMKWQEFVRNYLAFTRKERIGVLVVLILMLLIIFLPKLVVTRPGPNPSPIDTAWVAQIKKLEKKQTEDQQPYPENSTVSEYQYDRTKNKYTQAAKGELFYFDPNKLPIDGWKKLGLRDKTIQTIQNYLSKGGRFKKPEDLQKVYGLHQDEYEKIAPYVHIESLPAPKDEEQIVSTKSLYENTPPKTFTSHYSIIDINTADTTAFIALPGIGSKLAARIVNFREKLGGFYSIDQVGETFGLPDSTFQKIKQYMKLENISLRKININTATVDELKAHPYIRWSIANPIVAYRNEHGIFSKPEDIKKIAAVTEELYIKIAPYLIIQ